VAWPVALVAESVGDRSVAFRSYCSQRPLTGRHELRPPILQHQLPPQAGLGVYERGRDGLLAAVRVYDDVKAPPGIG
jgi:hypothetical protein